MRLECIFIFQTFLWNLWKIWAIVTFKNESLKNSNLLKLRYLSSWAQLSDIFGCGSTFWWKWCSTIQTSDNLISWDKSLTLKRNVCHILSSSYFLFDFKMFWRFSFNTLKVFILYLFITGRCFTWNGTKALLSSEPRICVSFTRSSREKKIWICRDGNYQFYYVLNLISFSLTAISGEN